MVLLSSQYSIYNTFEIETRVTGFAIHSFNENVKMMSRYLQNYFVQIIFFL